MVAPNSMLNIGRLDSNDIVLDDYKVSREHAVLKFTSAAAILIDLASSHGTYVNGHRIERAVVQFGDTIRVVNHELTLRHEMPRDIRDETGSLVMPRMARTLDRRLKFFGGLNEFPLLTLVQFLYQEKQSGLLLIELGQAPGPRIYIHHGDIIHVSQGENLAELLVREMHQPSLFFYFHHETNFPERTITESTPTYLMNLCHVVDQRKAAGETVRLKARTETKRVALPPIVR